LSFIDDYNIINIVGALKETTKPCADKSPPNPPEQIIKATLLNRLDNSPFLY